MSKAQRVLHFLNPFQTVFVEEDEVTLIAPYKTKKELKENIGKRLKHIETSAFGSEYQATGDFVVCNRPHITGKGREWFARVWMKDGLIVKVE